MIKKFKVFENINNIYKRFLIIKAANNLGYLLVELIRVEENFNATYVYFNSLFKLYKNSILPVDFKNNLTKKHFDKLILFQSDRLSNTLEHLRIIKETDKYNI